MNALCYKIVFSKRLGTLVAVGEHTAGQGKAAGTGVRSVVFSNSALGSNASSFVGSLKSLFVASTLACAVAHPSWAAPAANALPTNGVVQTGTATISSTTSTNGAAMTIRQSTDKASINWNSFSIGSAASVNVVQNNASSVLLNRVVGNDPSQIFGKLTANGQVILINPNGIVFGKGGSVTASAFTASTFGMTDVDFQNGKYKFNRNGSTAGVTVENGADIHTTTPGGYVALIGASVNNQGEIHTQQGAVVMAAGESVALPTALTESVGVPLSSKVRLELAPSTINASVENDGTITTEGGQVLMQAAAVADAVANITHTGTIDTTGEQGGAVTLQADHGVIKATGTIKANSTAGKKGGDIIVGRDEVTGILARATNVSGAKLESKGGFVETSGEWLATTGTRVLAKDWLLDPTDITITLGATTPPPDWTNQTQRGATILAGDIEANLNKGTSVTIQSDTVSTGTGNITVNAPINKTEGSEASLTLTAANDIILNKAITSSTSGGKLNVTLSAGNPTTGKVDINAAITSNGGNIKVETKGSGAINQVGSVSAGSGNVSYQTATGSGQTVSGQIFLRGASTLSGGNIYLDNTGGKIDSSTGQIEAGNAKSLSTGVYVYNANINATGNLYLTGSSSGSGNHGVQLNPSTTAQYAKVEAANIYVEGKSDTGIGVLVYNGALLQATSGNVTIKGTTTNGSDGINLQDSSRVLASADVTLNAGTKNLSLSNSSNANVNGTSLSGSITGANVTLIADQINILAPVKAVNAANVYGTVMLKNSAANVKINVGGADAAGTLGLINTELNKITAAKTVIGSASSGDITVSAATTTQSVTGDIELVTGGDVFVYKPLTIGNGSGTANAGDKNLTIKTRGAGSNPVNLVTNSADGVIKANQLAITANSVALTAAANQVNTLAASTTDAFAFKNGKALTIGEVDSVTGITAQNGVSVVTTSGDLTIGKSVKNSTSGNVVLGAGVDQAAQGANNNFTSDGDIKTASSATVTNVNRNTYLYTGSTSGTGNLSHLSDSLANLYLSAVDVNKQNTKLNTAYSNGTAMSANAIDNGASTQVMFRENTKFDELQINPTTLTKTVGQTDPSNATFAAAVAADNANGATLTKSTITQNKFKINTDAVGITGDLATPSHQARTIGTYEYKVTTPSGIASKVTSTSSTAPAAKLVVQPSDIIPVPTPGPLTPVVKPKDPVIPSNPFQLASAEDLANDICSANNLENCYCEESSLNKGVDICYEPKTAGNGATR